MAQYITKEGLQKLKDELHHLKTVENKRIVALIAEAAAFGDLKENAAYHDARDKMAFLRGRIEQLENAINEAVVIEKNNSPAGQEKVGTGSEVSILFSGKEEKYIIVSPAEADILNNKISYESPLGRSLMGRKIGNEFDFQAGNKTVKVKIIKIS